jgi:hypothetical protein
MHTKLFIEFGVGVGSGLAVISTQLKDSLAVMLASSRMLRAGKTGQSLASYYRRSHDLVYIVDSVSR